jgi:DUF4097 and DUF4098 domain-containing protein YvlB
MNRSDQERVRTVALHGIEQLRVEWPHGDLSFEGYPGLVDTVQVEAGDDDAPPALVRDGAALVLRQEQGWSGGGDLVIRLPSERALPIAGRLGHGDVTFHRVSGSIEFTTGSGDVEVSGGAGAVALSTGSGDVAVHERAGEITVHTGHGDVELTRCHGGARLELGSGDVEVSECAGALAVRSGHGDVEVVSARGQAVRIEARHGDVSLEGGTIAALRVHLGSGDVCSEATPAVPAGQAGLAEAEAGGDLVPGRYLVETGEGDISFEVPRDLPLRVEIVTGDGDVESDLPLVSVGRPGPRSAARRFVGATAGSDGERIEVTLKTGSGDVVLRVAGPAARPGPGRGDAGTAPSVAGESVPAPASATPAAPDAASRPSDAEVRAILEALERREVSVAEAELLLDALARRRH